ncbi:MAG: hypothetical protein QM625_10305 [Ralstonia sp.]|jgi:hypothetical protein|uniref:Lipoprotein n=3 Tax=Burkholderiaceae TaxID=119060 RepID=A0AAW4QCU7_RALPI|nr:MULTISPECIES: hypothetical protein [Ralstonia]MBX3756062.1 hypothetical protein [Ralstonia pickettii]MBX3779578.1 hypothetical protein [Ralstonia pickettii]MBX3784697.1 hypothetical protein [Ralstonia pickettii]MBX3790050.1 hypothetical protein [Ralstonia pickettii]MBX3794483.1 hypothetical protein [Ralstonia pickettii]
MRGSRTAASVSAIAMAAALAACGGGDNGTSSSAGGTTSTGTTGGTSTVASQSAATVASLGATPLSTSSTQDIYDLTAAIGDSWRLTVDTTNPNAPTFTITVQSTQYGLSSTSAAAVTKTVNGDFVSYTGSGLNVTVDTRTKTITGTATVGGKASTVTGTGYSATDGTKLAGTYAYAGRTTNTDGTSPYLAAGEFNIASDGATVTVCENGTFNGTGCTAVGNNVLTTRNLTMAYNATLPGFELKSSGTRVGVVRVAAGDRGPVVLIDWFNTTSSPVRTGILGGVKLATLAGNEFDGSWVCSDGLTPTVSGTAVTAGGVQYALDYNKLPVQATTGYSALGFNGVAAVMSSATYIGHFVLPLSASIALYGKVGTNFLAICAKR